MALLPGVAFGQTSGATGQEEPEGEIVELEEFEVISGFRESLASAIQSERESSKMMSVITATNIGTMPDKNVADALSRLPGVYISTDQGEGRFVSIRGIQPGLNNVTMNGELIAASDSSGRAASLDVLSASAASEIQVVKVITPDMDGHSIGGIRC